MQWFEADGVAEYDDLDPIEFDADGSEYDWDEETDAMIRDDRGSGIQGRYADNMPQALSQDNFTGIAQLLGHMPNPESLDLHMFQTLEYEAYDDASRFFFYARVFKAIVDQGLQFRQLRHLALRGICVNANDLITFIARHPQIENLELHNVMLSDRILDRQTWKKVVTKICHRAISGGGSLARIFCSDLAVVFRTARGIHRLESLLGDGEELKQEWIDRWWCGDPRGSASPVLYTRELLKDDIARADPFGRMRAGIHDGANTVVGTMPTNYPVNELRVLREERYGTTYG